MWRRLTDRAKAAARSQTGESEFTDGHDVQWGTNGILPRPCAASLKRVLDSGGRGSLEARCRLPCSSGKQLLELGAPQRGQRAMCSEVVARAPTTTKPLSWWTPLYNGLRLSCGPPAPQRRKMASIGPSARRGASGPTASSAG